MKQYHRYSMDFDGKAVRYSSICIGISVFLLVVHYLFVLDFTKVSVLEKIISFWVPIVISLAYLALLRVVRWNAPGLYAIIGCVYCLILFLDVLIGGGFLRILLAFAGYAVSGLVLVLTAGGYFPGRTPAGLSFLLMLVGRLLLFTLGRVSGLGWLPEIANLCMIASWMILPSGMIGKKIEA